ncbi:hypothetical protein [Streptococcus gallolyticus]|uniref:Cupin domain-containing protein n=1 Tax=Streptococcus gallolyticus TaxID=315405 RepID=A0A139QL32_9STRE|nr:hypothetical protein [Streptococcus gallolyticus]KXT63634.1 hypothetical protein SGADD02_02191 [Streptococcus gallolyticus]KXU03235.1 hypothetical protein SGADD03_02168 [Streptococcus gallolyticus]
MIKDLKTLVKYHDGQIASRSLSKTLEATNSITLYAMAKGESISRESSHSTKLIYVLEGNLQLKTDSTTVDLVSDSLETIPAKMLHDFLALEDCKFLQIELSV